MMEPFYRFRNAFWSFWYGSVVTYFGIQKGYLFISAELIREADAKNGVYRIPLRKVN